MSLTRWIRAGFFAGMLVTVGACAQPMKPMQFNNRIARANQKLGQSAAKFYKALEPLSKGAPAEAAAQGAYSDLTNALREIQKDFEKIAPPPGAGSDLMDKYRAFLKTQQSIFDNVITPMWKIVQDNATYPDPGSKWVAISPLLARASDEENKAMETLKKSQEAYCKQFTLEPK